MNENTNKRLKRCLLFVFVVVCVLTALPFSCLAGVTETAIYYNGTNFFTDAACTAGNEVKNGGGTAYTTLATLLADVETSETALTIYMKAGYTVADTQTVSCAARPVTLMRSGDMNGDGTADDPYTGALITVSGTGVLTLENITVDGGAVWSSADLATRTNNGILAENAMVSVSGSLTLQSGAFLQNNDNTGNAAGGVSVTGADAALTINGGTISGNATQGFYGGGVDMDGGSFSMAGGTISGNTVNGAGGGVSLSSTTTVMTDGTISGNAAKGGGGAYVSNGSFNMTGGFISNNTAQEGGGFFGNAEKRRGRD